MTGRPKTVYSLRCLPGESEVNPDSQDPDSIADDRPTPVVPDPFGTPTVRPAIGRSEVEWDDLVRHIQRDGVDIHDLFLTYGFDLKQLAYLLTLVQAVRGGDERALEELHEQWIARAG